MVFVNNLITIYDISLFKMDVFNIFFFLFFFSTFIFELFLKQIIRKIKQNANIMKNKNGDILFENQNQLHHLKFLFISDFSSFLFVSPSLICLLYTSPSPRDQA
eukprot:TRINITY_DN16363_c0_g1_i1.p1 TRINITY_DN16363_c0_g1~~TRINITY_DN16363_c0_g1_i1.p1  ORF type:complete len:104 (+),score=18.35 TRINITY_DN16363_c0_g1_i1:101-412(+)